MELFDEDYSIKFWSKWLEAKPKDKLHNVGKLVEILKDGFRAHEFLKPELQNKADAQLLNSYFEDLAITIIKRNSENEA
jgi:hypothetical protein